MSEPRQVTTASVYTEEFGPTSDVPRRKCCTDCAFRRHDPHGLQASSDWPALQDDWASGWATFYCLHTADLAGRHQVCAAFQALYGNLAA